MKKFYINHKVKKSEKLFENYKTNSSLQNYLDEVVNKIEYLLKNVNREFQLNKDIYDEKLIREEIQNLYLLIENCLVMVNILFLIIPTNSFQ